VVFRRQEGRLPQCAAFRRILHGADVLAMKSCTKSRVAALLLFVPLLSSCLQMDQEVKLAADGSGTQRVVLDLTPQVLSTAAKFAGVARPGESSGDPQAVFRADKVRAELEEAGLTMTTHGSETVRGVRRLTIEAEFKSTEVLQQSPLGGGRAQWLFVRGTEAGTLRVIYYPQGREAHEQALVQVARMASGGADEAEQRWFEQQKARLNGLDLRFTVTLPGDVKSVSSNWTVEGHRTCRAVIRAGDVKSPSDLVRLLAPRYEAVIDGRSVTIPVLDREPPAEPR
jgi:hypothetical protein